MLRAQQAIPGLPSVKMITSHPMSFDDAFVTLANRWFWEGRMLGNAPDQPIHLDAYNILTVTLRDYFKGNFRPDTCVHFFSRLLDRCPFFCAPPSKTPFHCLLLPYPRPSLSPQAACGASY